MNDTLIPRQTIPLTFQDVVCPKCSKHLTDARNAVVANDMENGGLKGRHLECPKPEAPKPELVPFTKAHEELLLTVARVFKSSLGDLGGHYADRDAAAIREALAPFDPLPGPGQTEGKSSS